MTRYYYIRIQKPMSREAFLHMVEQFQIIGIINAEYDQGGWNDYFEERTFPHLRFTDEKEAILYVLKFGGEITRTIPMETISQ